MKRLMRIINNTEELFVGYVLFLLAVGATLQVVMRYVFGICFDWFEELSRYLLILITFVGAGLGVKYGAHLSMDFATQYAPDWLAHCLKVLTNLLSSLVMAFVCYFSWLQIIQSREFGVLSSAARLPMWLAYLPIGIFSAVISLRFLALGIKHIWAIIHKDKFQRT